MTARRRALLVGMAYVVVAFAWTARLWVDPAQRQPPNSPDVALFTWLLTWDAHPSLSLHADQLGLPHGVNVMWQTAVLLPGLLLAPLTRVAGAQVTYNLLLTLGPAVSATAAYAVLRRLVRNEGGAFLGGLLYGFGPAMVAQTNGGHLHLTLAALPPVLLLLTGQVLTGRRRPVATGLVLGGLAGLQLLIGEELLAITALAALLLVLVVRPPWRRLATTAAAGVPGFGLLAGWPLLVQFLGPQHVHGHVQQLGRFREDLAAYVVPSRLLAFSGPHPDWPTGLQEVTAYVGGPLLGLTGYIVVRRWRDVRVRVAAALGVALGLLALGPNLVVLGYHTGVPLPWALIERIPVVGNVLPSRLPILAGLAAAVLVATVVERWGRRGLAAATIALLALLPAPLDVGRVPGVPAYFTTAPAGRVLVLPFPTPHDTAAMRWQAAAGLSFGMPGGFFVGPDGDGQARFGAPDRPTSLLLARVARTGVVPVVGPIERADLARDDAYWRVDAIVLGPCRFNAALRDTVTALLDRPPVERAGVQHWAL